MRLPLGCRQGSWRRVKRPLQRSVKRHCAATCRSSTTRARLAAAFTKTKISALSHIAWQCLRAACEYPAERRGAAESATYAN